MGWKGGGLEGKEGDRGGGGWEREWEVQGKGLDVQLAAHAAGGGCAWSETLAMAVCRKTRNLAAGFDRGGLQWNGRG